MTNPGLTNYYFNKNYQNKIGLFVKLVSGMQKSHVLKVEELSRTRLIENQDTIHELTARIQELQNEVNCLNDSRDYKDAESVRSGLSHVTSQPALLPPLT